MTTRRLGRFITGRRKPSAVFQRTPLRWFTSKKPEPSLFPSLKSARGSIPNSLAPSCTASRISPAQALPRDLPAAAGRMHGARPGVVILGLQEVRQDVVPRPADVAELTPDVVVGRLTPHVDHAVDRRAPAEHLAARVREAAPVEARLGRGLHHPVGPGVAHAVQIPHRNADPVVAVAPPRLQQEHSGARVLGQAIRKHAAGGAGTDDDVVVVAVEGLNARHALDSPIAAVVGASLLRPPGADTALAGCRTRDERRCRADPDARIVASSHGPDPEPWPQCSRNAAADSKAPVCTNCRGSSRLARSRAFAVALDQNRRRSAGRPPALSGQRPPAARWSKVSPRRVNRSEVIALA